MYFDLPAERRRREQERELTADVLAVLNRTNDVGEMVHDILGLIRTHTGLAAAAVRLQDNEDFPYREVQGFPSTFVHTERSLCARDQDGGLLRDADGSAVLECMCGAVVSGRLDPAAPWTSPGGSFWTNGTTTLLASTSETDRGRHTRNACNRWGYESVALIPLRSDNGIIGLLQLNDPRPDQFTNESVRFFEGLSASLGVALARRRAAAELRRSEARARALFDGSPNGVFVFGPDDRCVQANPMALARTGYSVEELRAMTALDLAAPASREHVAVNLALARAGSIEFECRHRRRDGVEYPVEVGARTLDLDGQPCLLLIEHDVTKRKKVEEESALLQAELLQAHKMESIGRLAGGIAHDFNNLLTVINGLAYLEMKQLKAEDPLRSSFAEILAAGDRAAALTRHLLAFSRREVLDPITLDLHEVVTGMEPLLARLLGAPVDLRLGLDAGNALVFADPHQIEQVIMNLAVNARDAMPDGGVLSITTANASPNVELLAIHPSLKPGQYVVLTVTDTGVGMDEATRLRIFEPFFTTKRADAGTGLGLSVVHGVVAQSGGCIEVRSEPGRGTTFAVYLPINDGMGGSADVSLPLAGTETILVVDDQAEVRLVAAEALRAYGYRTIPAASGSEALMHFAQDGGHIDLAVIDAVMPNMSGLELAAHLEARQPDIRLLFISGYTQDIIAPRLPLRPGSDFLHKPFTPEDLARKVRTILGPPVAHTEELTGG